MFSLIQCQYTNLLCYKHSDDKRSRLLKFCTSTGQIFHLNLPTCHDEHLYLSEYVRQNCSEKKIMKFLEIEVMNLSFKLANFLLVTFVICLQHSHKRYQFLKVSVLYLKTIGLTNESKRLRRFEGHYRADRIIECQLTLSTLKGDLA